MLRILTILLILASIVIAQFACKSGKGAEKTAGQKEFEGLIVFHEISKTSDGFIDIDDTVQMFYAHGNFVNIHMDVSQKLHIIRDYYFADKALRLFMFNNSDTLNKVNLNFPGEKLDSFKLTKINDQILGKKCESIELSTSYPEKDSTTSYTDFVFVFSRGYLNVDKEHFKNWNLGFFNKVASESGAFYLKFKAVHFDSSHKHILSIKKYDVIAVKEQPVDPIIFEIDTSKIKIHK